MSRSSQPSLNEARAVFRLLGDVRDLRHDAHAWQRQMVHGLCGLLGARQGTALRFGGFSPTGDLRLLDVAHGGWANAAAAALWEGLLRGGNPRGDVLVDRATHVRGDVVAVLRNELVPDADFYRSPLVQELMPIVEVDSHVMGWHRLAGPGDRIVGLTFHRCRRERPFGAKHRAVVRLFLEELSALHREGKMAGAPEHPPVPYLTPREGQVLRRLLLGDSIKEAAAALGLSRHTVHGYVKVIYQKHGAASRAELLGRYLRPGVFEAPREALPDPFRERPG